MSKSLLRVITAANVVILVWTAWNVSSYAQRPPESNPDGVPYLKVNINPSAVPPSVNINPAGTVPRVAVTELPEVRTIAPPPRGCEDSRGYDTGIAKSISGPIQIGFLNLPPSATVTLAGSKGGKVTLSAASHLASVIYLRDDQRLEFDSDVMYSGCRPAR